MSEQKRHPIPPLVEASLAQIMEDPDASAGSIAAVVAIRGYIEEMHEKFYTHVETMIEPRLIEQLETYRAALQRIDVVSPFDHPARAVARAVLLDSNPAERPS